MKYHLIQDYMDEQVMFCNLKMKRSTCIKVAKSMGYTQHQIDNYFFSLDVENGEAELAGDCLVRPVYERGGTEVSDYRIEEMR